MNINKYENGIFFTDIFDNLNVVVAQDLPELNRDLVYYQRYNFSKVRSENEVHNSLKENKYDSGICALWSFEVVHFVKRYVGSDFDAINNFPYNPKSYVVKRMFSFEKSAKNKLIISDTPFEIIDAGFNPVQCRDLNEKELFKLKIILYNEALW